MREYRRIVQMKKRKYQFHIASESYKINSYDPQENLKMGRKYSNKYPCSETLKVEEIHSVFKYRCDTKC